MALGQETLTHSRRPRLQNSSSGHAKPLIATRVARFLPVLDKSVKLYKLVGVGREQIMRMLLAGKIPSSTGLGYRGKGLPSISDSMRDKHAVSRLVIIRNDVYVDVGTDRFDLLPRHLKGLLLYWEVPYGNWRTNQNGQS